MKQETVRTHLSLGRIHYTVTVCGVSGCDGFLGYREVYRSSRQIGERGPPKLTPGV